MEQNEDQSIEFDQQEDGIHQDGSKPIEIDHHGAGYHYDRLISMEIQDVKDEINQDEVEPLEVELHKDGIPQDCLKTDFTCRNFSITISDCMKDGTYENIANKVSNYVLL